MWAKLYEAALGVQYLHARGVIHGDLKGNNVVIGSDLKAKVTDFGLSSITTDDGTPLISCAAHWVAPECFINEKARPTFASDIYSLGMCIVEALRFAEAVQLGKDPKRCLPWGLLANNIVKFHVKKGELPSRSANCDDDQWRLVERMCVFDPDKRIKISTVVDELARLAGIPDIRETEIITKIPEGMEAVREVISAARELLTQSQNQGKDVANPDKRALNLMYGSLWDRFDQVHHQIHAKGDFEGSASFCLLVGKADECTKKLQVMAMNLKSLVETTLQCSTLGRRLDKFLDAHFLH